VIATYKRFGLALAFTIGPVLAANSDSDLERAIVGIWRVASKTESKNGKVASTTYSADGTFIVRLYADASCKTLEQEASGVWQIKDRQLHMKTTKSIGTEQRARVGTSTKDRVVSIEGDTMELLNAAGHSLYRTKGTPCDAK
jgi:hypothetical protein